MLRSALLAILATAFCVGPASAATCAQGDAEPGVASQRAIVVATLCLINEERHARGLPRVSMSRLLTYAARRHSRDMVRRRYFAHQAPGGPDLVQRVRGSGYLRAARGWHLGENLGWGTPGRSSASAMVRAWMLSPPHRRAILTPAYRDVGIGIVAGIPSAAGRGGTYTVDFGARR
jgi:uncharacterized protein YkwD